MRKLIALFSVIAILFSFSSCGGSSEEETFTAPKIINDETTVESVETVTEVIAEIVTNTEGETEILTEIVEVEPTTEKDTNKSDSTDNKNSTTKKSTTSNDPSKWSKEEVVNFYKKACSKSSNVTSTQTMSMRKGSLKAAGGIGKFLNIAEPIIRKVLELNSTKFSGITGGHQNLVATDCKSAKAYKSGDYTVVEMTMVEQIDGVYGKKNSGTVGHAISVVDGVAEAAAQFPAFDIYYEDADIEIYYTEAKLKVKINSKGVIEKGTWSYVVTPVVNDLYIEKLLVNGAGAVVDYKVVVGGGF